MKNKLEGEIRRVQHKISVPRNTKEILEVLQTILKQFYFYPKSVTRISVDQNFIEWETVE